MYLDLNARLYLVRRLFFRRASQNVVSNGARSDAPSGDRPSGGPQGRFGHPGTPNNPL